MGMFAHLANHFDTQYSNVENNINNITKEIEILNDKLHQVRFWDFKVLRQLNEVNQLQNHTQYLKNKVNEINQEIFNMQHEGNTEMDESDYHKFASLNKRAGQIKVTISSHTEKNLSKIKKYLVENNFWTGVSDIFKKISDTYHYIEIRLFKLTLKVEEKLKLFGFFGKLLGAGKNN